MRTWFVPTAASTPCRRGVVGRWRQLPWQKARSGAGLYRSTARARQRTGCRECEV